jgi:hypothetical protein
VHGQAGDAAPIAGNKVTSGSAGEWTARRRPTHRSGATRSTFEALGERGVPIGRLRSRHRSRLLLRRRRGVVRERTDFFGTLVVTGRNAK